MAQDNWFGETENGYETGCKAIVGTTGEQCGNGDAELCGTHEKSRSVTRVDEFENSVDEDLRDALVQECDIPGEQAYALATVADGPAALWRLVTGLEPVVIGGEEWSAWKLRLKAEAVAKHPDLDVDWHPLANDNCIAIVEDGQYGDEYRCTTSAHGNLLCGVHDGANNLRTILDEDWKQGPDVDEVWLDGERHWLIEQRGESPPRDAIVITPDFEYDRLYSPVLETPAGLPLGVNGWELVSGGDDPWYQGYGRTEQVRLHQVDQRAHEIVATNPDARATVEEGLEWIDAVDELAGFVRSHSPEDVEAILAGDRGPDRTVYSNRPGQLAGTEEGTKLSVVVGGTQYRGEVRDIGTGGWDTAPDEMGLTLSVDDVTVGGEHGQLMLESQRDPFGQWTAIEARFLAADADVGDSEVLGTVDRVEIGEGESPESGREPIVWRCDSCGNTVECEFPMRTCVECGGNMEQSDEPLPPESLPKYLREGAERQDPSTLRDLAAWAAELADYKKAEAERELEERSVDEQPEAWDEDEWEDQLEDARDEADIPPSKGTLTTKTIDGRDYYYLQWREGGKVRSQYVAPVSPAGSD